MKIVRVTIDGVLAPGDELLVHVMSPRGGRSTAGAIVEKDRAELDVDGKPIRVRDTHAAVAKRLADSATHYLLSDSFTITANENVIRFECKDAVSDVAFLAEVKGSKTVRLNVEEF